MQSEERYLGDGFFPLEKEFFTLVLQDRYNDGFNQTESFGGFQIEMSLDTVSYNRSIYSILDFLGDVGGLYSILLDIGSLFILIHTYFFGSLMHEFLTIRIFNSKTSNHTEKSDLKLKRR